MSGKHETGESRALARRTLGIVIPVVVIAVGWFVASYRGFEARRAQWRRDRQAHAAMVAAAVAEGLEELRAREDEREYYLYSYAYAPPDLVGNEESVAFSPLGRLPTDARLRGWFQINPGPVVVSPMTDEGTQPRVAERGREVVAIIREMFAPQAERLIARSEQLSDRGGAIANARVAQLRSGSVDNNVVDNASYGQLVLRDIRASQNGDPEALERARNRPRSNPRVRVAWWSASSSAYAPAESLRVENDRATRSDAFPALAELRFRQLGPVRVWLPNTHADSDGRATVEALLPENGIAREGRDESTAAYTPMVFAESERHVWMFRVVRTGNATSVQGVLLDGDILRNQWATGVARRHGFPGETLSVVAAAESRSSCVAAATFSGPLGDRAACVNVARAHEPWRPFGWQLTLLGGILVLVVSATIARERALRRARQLARLERGFVASVSHELRTPITTVRMHAEMLQEGWVAEEQRSRVVGEIVQGADRLSRLIDNVLTFGRLAEGRHTVRLEYANLADHVEAVVLAERNRLAVSGVEVEFRREPHDVFAHFDRAGIEQVICNLIENAAKYAGGENPPRIDVVVSLRGEQAVMIVRDFGPGIAPEDRERVFDRFYRGRNARDSHVAGTGLGLAIVRGLVENMQGRVRVLTPERGRGCLIEITLPKAEGGGLETVESD